MLKARAPAHNVAGRAVPISVAPISVAYATLNAGCAFFEQRADEQPVSDGGWAHIAHARMTGNRLRELDRFLSVLIEAVASGLDDRGHDRAGLARLRNTARKLRLVEDMTGAASGADARLRAIGRVTACLHHCTGRIHADSIHEDVRIAGGVAVAGSFSGGSGRLRIEPQTILAICAFYRDMGDWMLLRTAPARRDLDFAESLP
ncbi:MAG: hypothetical protein AB7E05_10730 [Sphingobium sp.]